MAEILRRNGNSSGFRPVFSADRTGSKRFHANPGEERCRQIAAQKRAAESDRSVPGRAALMTMMTAIMTSALPNRRNTRNSRRAPRETQGASKMEGRRGDA